MPPAAALRAPFSPATKTLISTPLSSSLPFPKYPPSSSRCYLTILEPRPLRSITATSTTTGSIPLSGPVYIYQELGLNEIEAQSLLLKHPDLGSASPQSLHLRILSLQSVGFAGPALLRTVTRRPEILTSPEIEPFLDFVRHELQGLRPIKLERLLVGTPSRLLSGFSARVRVLLQHGIPPENLGHLLNDVNIRKVFCDRPSEHLVEMILFLKRYGWPDLVLRRPMLLNLDLHSQLKPRVEFLSELGGGDEAAVGVLIRKLPGILAYSVEHFRSHVKFWQSVGLTGDHVFKIALVYPNIFSVSRDRKLRPRIEFLEQCGLSSGDIFRFLIKAPLFVSLSSRENLSKKLGLLVKIGHQHRTRELALAVGATTRTSCENMQMVVGVFLSYGLSCEDVMAMSRKHPQVLQYNHESLERKIDFLVEEMGREIGELLVFPAFLGYKLDDRIKRRYEAKKNSRGERMSLNKLLSVSAERFVLLEEEPDKNAV